MKRSKILTAGVLALGAVLILSSIIVATAPFIAAVVVITIVILYINTSDEDNKADKE